MRTYEDEKEYYARGAKHFGYDVDELSNKREYKEATTLNCAIWSHRRRKKIIVVTECVLAETYLDALIKEPMVGFDIYCIESRVKEFDYTIQYDDKVKFIKVTNRFKQLLDGYKTIVLIDDKTIIYDYKYFGLYREYGVLNGNKNVYIVTNKKKYKEKYDKLMELLDSIKDWMEKK